MSDILIKGMEMPKNCYGCPFFTQVDYWNKNDEADILSKCKRTGEFTWESVNGYLPNCPLFSVPPHGRLIDADALTEKLKKHREYHSDGSNSGAAISNGIGQCLDIINGRECPTIIEAEEGE